ncbi:hypothetical protein FN846DRAFT_817875 [Sphaerosporella brunnea]|uniref:Uncharacterized protein n=1 Tax=Sphaerosporella brunnea TaxID=1250544 RepID=A0A5J5EKP6_9PEZI|nr:hypothetical protein FN846DRAFT_817875 [Sphaerosporella brunnea]
MLNPRQLVSQCLPKPTRELSSPALPPHTQHPPTTQHFEKASQPCLLSRNSGRCRNRRTMFLTLYRWLWGDRAAASSTRTSSVCSETLPPHPSSYTPPSSPTPSRPPSPLPKLPPPPPAQCNLNTPPSTGPASSSPPSLPSDQSTSTTKRHRIVVSSGRCRSRYCGCPQGIFDLPFVAAENATAPCIGNSSRPGCLHSLSDHEGYPSSDIQGELPLHSDTVQPYIPRPTANTDPFRLVNPIIYPPAPTLKYSPRNDTVRELYEQLRKHRVIHVRGTPTSGKTTLTKLLKRFVEVNLPHMTVVSFSWRGNAPVDWVFKPYDWLIPKFSACSYQGDLNDYGNVLLIVDEAQNSYRFASFWNELIKYQAQGVKEGPYIALFSSFGSPSAGTSQTEDDYTTPPHLKAEQRVSMRPLPDNNPAVSLYLTRSEFSEVVLRAKTNAEGLHFSVSKKVEDFLFDVSAGHPGCTSALLEVLQHSKECRKFRKKGGPVDLKTTIAILNDPKFFDLVMAAAGFGRSFPPKDTLKEKPDHSRVMQQAVVRHRVRGNINTDASLAEVYKKGWLHAEQNSDGEVEYIFPTEIHRLYCERLLCSLSQPFPTAQFPTLGAFWRAVLRGFSSNSLAGCSHGLASGGLQRPVEAQFADEFYRCAFELLGSRSYLTSEWSGAGSRGCLDFFVRGAGWGIELLIEGRKLNEHVERFEQGGSYDRWLASRTVNDYVIIDFRTSAPEPKGHTKLYHIVLDSQQTEYEIYDSHGMSEGPFRLLG